MMQIYILILTAIGVNGQFSLNVRKTENTLTWCTVNAEEQRKCVDMMEYLQDNPIYDATYRRSDSFNLMCNQTTNKDECMALLDNNLADITSLDAGEVFVGGRYHSLVPIIEERYKVEGSGDTNRIYAVAVVRKSVRIDSLRDLRGKKACFGGVGTLAGWVVPLDKLIKDGGMEIVDCNNHVKSAIEYFGPSCSVNSLSDKYNPLGDNSDRLCQICGSDQPGVTCTSSDPYAGYEGALNCLLDQGEVAFLKHSTVDEYFISRAAIIRHMNSQPGEPQDFSPTSSQSPFNPQNPFNPFGQNTQFQGNPFTPRPYNPFDNFTGFGGTGRNFGAGRDFNEARNPNQNLGLEEERINKFRHGLESNTITSQEFSDKFELLCPDSSRRRIEEWRNCFWDEIPSHTIVTSSAKTPMMRTRYQRFFQNLLMQFGQKDFSNNNNEDLNSGFRQNNNNNNVNRIERIKLFESVPRYGNRSNLLFQDATVSFRSIPESDQLYEKYLGGSLKSIMDIRSCPIGRMTLCVTSEPELAKCKKMRTALNAQLLKPEMSCQKAHSHINCMQKIRGGEADAGVFEAGDVYTGGYQYNLIPVLSEIYNLKEPEYYAVAVAYQGDPDTELTYLKGKSSCHSGMASAAGWIIPLAYLISSGRMRNYGCDSLLAASQYFTKSCVPGALSNEYNFGQEYNNLCDLCRGSSSAYCNRDASEDFYGNTGAFRCLIEGGGQVAFVKHTTVSEITDGKRRETWARNTLAGDYELLCRDGTRAPVKEFKRCNLGKVKANAVMVRGGRGYNETETKAIVNLFLYAQHFYGRKFAGDINFGMFYSPAPYSDLIFQDAAQQLRIVAPEEQNYRDYLGKNFLKARALVDCYAASSNLHPNLLLSLLPFITLTRLILNTSS